MANNFKRLQDETPAPPRVQKQIRQGLDDNIGFIRFILDIVDLYVPKVMQLFTPSSSIEHKEDPASTGNGRSEGHLDRMPNIGIKKMNIDESNEEGI